MNYTKLSIDYYIAYQYKCEIVIKFIIKMPKYFCEYCGIYLTQSSPYGRKQHVKGKKHISNKIEYFSQFLLTFQRQIQTGNFD